MREQKQADASITFVRKLPPTFVGVLPCGT